MFIPKRVHVVSFGERLVQKIPPPQKKLQKVVIEINKNELSAKFEGVNVKALFNLLNF
jgi:hypothetical protein